MLCLFFFLSFRSTEFTPKPAKAGIHCLFIGKRRQKRIPAFAGITDCYRNWLRKLYHRVIANILQIYMIEIGHHVKIGILS
ncbi:Uncharacterized protein dnm_049470 [Desulfonema magnum]|uniref:Uncharacterized protein n=1 Tax=Desulfonema magnum TaxID=45655 RepID=A0A975BPW5_9BACT|nr:Uncharacterized protein dnm_049470 [Desulfonema magnum]